jgi:hypothetical protein
MNAPSAASEELIGIVQPSSLGQLHWPIMQAFCPAFVARRELDEYVRRLLATGRWLSVRTVPVGDGDRESCRLYQIYGKARATPSLDPPLIGH